MSIDLMDSEYQATIVSGLMVQCSDDSYVYAVKGYDIYRKHQSASVFEYVTSVKTSFIRKSLSRFRLLSRLFRLGIRRLFIGHQCILVLVGNELFQFDDSVIFPELVHEFEFGAPLNILYIKEHNKYYFGTYHSGGSSLPIRIFSSSNLRDWDCLYEFPIGSVRHVHGVFYQKKTGRIYVATGDKDSESRILFTEDNFLSVKTLVSGSQAARVVSIIFDGYDAILFTDSPDTLNYVYRLPTNSKFDFGLQVRAGSLIEGPCINVAEKRGSIYFSTVAERSVVNNDMQSVVYHMDVSGNVSRLFACTRDLKWLKKFRPYFMHPTFFITAPSFGDDIFFSAVGIENYDGSTICLTRNENVEKT